MNQTILKSVRIMWGLSLRDRYWLSPYLGLVLACTYSHVLSRMLCIFWILSEGGTSAMTPLNYPKLADFMDSIALYVYLERVC